MMSSTKKTTAAEPTLMRPFEFREGNSSKFWHVSRQGMEVMVRFGRTGTAGQTQVKSFDDEAAAVKHIETLVKQKIAKGYTEVR